MTAMVSAEPGQLTATRRFGRWPRPGALLGTGLWVATLLAVVLSLLHWLGMGAPDLPLSFVHGPAGVGAISVCALVYATIGGALAARVRGNPVGWLLLAIGGALASILPISLAVADALSVLRPAPAATLIGAWVVSSFLVPPAIAAQTAVMVLFPNGRLVTARWGWAIVASSAGAALLSIGLAFGPTNRAYPSLATPLPVPETLTAALPLARIAGVALLVLSTAAAAGALIRRYRSADVVVRQQLRWIVLAGIVLAMTLTPYVVGGYVARVDEGTGEFLVTLAALGASVFPIVVAIAVLRYDLFDIDRLIRRTLVYVPLTATLAGLFATGLWAVQRLFIILTGDSSDMAVAVTTLLLAAMFQPLRTELESAVDRRFHPHRDEPQPSAEDLISPAEDARFRELEEHVRRLERLLDEKRIPERRRIRRPSKVPGHVRDRGHPRPPSHPRSSSRPLART
jgi:hypothetical protein